MKICFLVSGNGGNLKFLYLAKKKNLIKNLHLFVIADRECNAFDFATKNNIYSNIINYNKSCNTELLYELNIINPDIIITTWNKIIDKDVILKYNNQMINLHYSLLPQYAGLMGITPIKKAIKDRSNYIGATCHYINEQVDAGEIICQFKLKNNFNLNSMIKKIFKNGCLILLNSIIIIKKQNIVERKKNLNTKFNPELTYDEKKFDDEFWSLLLKL
tara:strand:+ start:93 stop:743 length:651 start_codon:yes stop_codon:yes gene_type:complete